MMVCIMTGIENILTLIHFMFRIFLSHIKNLSNFTLLWSFSFDSDYVTAVAQNWMKTNNDLTIFIVNSNDFVLFSVGISDPLVSFLLQNITFIELNTRRKINFCEQTQVTLILSSNLIKSSFFSQIIYLKIKINYTKYFCSLVSL